MGQAQRFNSGKPRLSFIDQDSFMDTADVLEFGSKKYSRDNWKKGMPLTEIIDSLERHLGAMKRGEFLDPESGLPHHAHIGCNVMFMSHVLRYYPEFIDLNFKEQVLKYYESRKHIPYKTPDVSGEDDSIYSSKSSTGNRSIVSGKIPGELPDNSQKVTSWDINSDRRLGKIPCRK